MKMLGHKAVNESYIALTRSYVVSSMPGLFFCFENAMFLLVKRKLLTCKSYMQFLKVGIKEEMT